MVDEKFREILHVVGVGAAEAHAGPDVVDEAVGDPHVGKDRLGQAEGQQLDARAFGVVDVAIFDGEVVAGLFLPEEAPAGPARLLAAGVAPLFLAAGELQALDVPAGYGPVSADGRNFAAGKDGRPGPASVGP